MISSMQNLLHYPLFLLLLVSTSTLQAQEYAVACFDGEDVSFRIYGDDFFVDVSLYGKLYDYGALDDGEYRYDYRDRLVAIGDVEFEFDYADRLSKIGGARVEYDYKDDISSIGDVDIRYDYRDLVSTVDGHTVRWDYKDDFKGFGTAEIHYDYADRVSRIEDDDDLIYYRP